MRYNNSDKYNFYLSPSIGYNYSKSNIQKTEYANYFLYGGSCEFFIKLSDKMGFYSDLNADLPQQIKNSKVRNVHSILWNSSLYRLFLKDNSLKLSVLVNDILNKNLGISRMASSNLVYNETYWKRNRYFLLKLECSFNKMPK